MQNPETHSNQSQRKGKVSRSNLNKMYERMAKDPMSFLASTAPNVKVSVTDEHGNPMKSFSIPYNHIEQSE